MYKLNIFADKTENPTMPNMKTPPINKRMAMPPEQVKRLSPSQFDAYNYLNKKRIFEFFQFLICHLLAEQPEDPVAFLGNLLDRCMMFRSGLAEPPLLFTAAHVEAMYSALDPHGKGLISQQQYENGLKTMNIVGYDAHPLMDDDGMVSKEIFVGEALDCLTRALLAMLRVGEVSGASTAWKIPVLDVLSPTDSEVARAAAERLAAAAAEEEQPEVAETPLLLPPHSMPGYVPPRLCNVPMSIRPISPSELITEIARRERYKPGYVSQPSKKIGLGPPPSLHLPDIDHQEHRHHRGLGPPPRITDFPPLVVCDSEKVLAEHLPADETKA